MLTTTKEVDSGFSISIISIQAFFIVEVIASCLYIDNYFLRFYFWLDFISIVSMLLDIHWIYEFAISLMSTSSTKQERYQSRSAKVGSRAIRVLRVVRLIRIVRITKIYKLKEKFGSDGTTPSFSFNSSFMEKSKVGKKLSDSTMHRVIVLVLSMIMGIIIFNPNFYYKEITSLEYGIKMFNEFDSLEDPAVNITIDAYLSNHIVSPVY